MKRNFMLILIFVLLISSSVVFANENNTITTANMLLEESLEMERSISLILDGELLTFDTSPKVIEGRTLVPVRKILEALDTKVEWIDSEQKVVANNDNLELNLWIDKKEMLVNGEKVLLDVPPMVLNSRTYIPVRAVAEVLDSEVYWDGKTKSVLILNQENEEKAKELYKLLSNTDFSPGILFNSDFHIDNTSRLLEGKFNVQLENRSENLDYPLEDMYLTLEAGYSGFNSKTSLNEDMSLEGTISTQSSDVMTTFDLDLLFTDNGEELPYVLSYPISKEELSLAPVKNMTSFDLIAAYLAPYLDIEDDGYNNSYYTITYIDPIEKEFNKIKSEGEEIAYVIAFTDYGSDYSFEAFDFLVKLKLLTTNNVFLDYPYNLDSRTSGVSKYNDVYLKLYASPFYKD